MEHEMFAPPIFRRVEVEQRALIEPQMTPAPHTLEEVRAVDAAFVGNADLSDQALGLMGLSLSVPWLIDLVAEQLRPAQEEKEEAPRPQLGNDEEK
jgi:hypothetical protein